MYKQDFPARQRDFEKHIDYLSPQEQTQIMDAFGYAYKAHQGQKRKSGEPYINHCIATAKELLELKMDAQTIMAGLLHDVPEDTDHSIEEVQEYFGVDVARLVAGVTKLGQVRLRSKKEQQARNLRKMFLAMAEDVRVIIIKLCDRLHNMRTIEALPRAKQKGIARETLEIYAPLANRLGMGEIRWELEDLCFSCIEPKRYKEIKKAVAKQQGKREEILQRYLNELEILLKDTNIEARISGRTKHYYSIYRNVYLTNKEESIEDLLDSIGIRVIVRSVSECYQVLGLVHRVWRPIVGRFKDFIAIPKSNGYQSLHTGVITDNGSKLEIQIRTEEMNFVAEYGMAAHWKYKDSHIEYDKSVEERMKWIHQLLDWQKEFRTALDFVESLKLDVFKEQIFVFTPRGDVKDLPTGATPVDFAYSVHTELGHSCVGAKVNGRMVPLSHQLKSGDIIQILSSKKKEYPNRAWLEFVQTSRAKEKIRSWFKKQHREENIQRGLELLTVKLEKVYGKKLDEITENDWENAAKNLNYHSKEDLLSAVGFGEIGSLQLSNKLMPEEKKTNHQDQSNPIGEPTLTTKLPSRQMIRGVGDLLVKFAPCCSPLEGDKIAGFISRGRGIIVHRVSCDNIIRDLKHEPERVIDLDWKTYNNSHFEIDLIIIANDRKSLMRDITTAISKHDISIEGLHYQGRSGGQKVRFPISIEVKSIRQLNNLIRSLEEVPGIYSVRRR